MKTNYKITLSFIILVLSLFIIACDQEPPVDPIPKDPITTTPIETKLNLPEIFNPDEEIKPIKFKSLEEFNEFVINAGTSNFNGGFGLPMAIEERAVSADSLSVTKAGSVSAPTDFSQTNVQVQGVDEADIIKTDGNYIYTISGNTLFIVNAYPGENAKIIYQETFENRPQGLFVNNNKLAVFGEFNDLDYFKEIDFRPQQGMTYFNIYDIEDKSNPEIIEEYKFEGRYFQSRMIDDYVYYVTTSSPQFRVNYPTPVFIEDGFLRTTPIGDISYFPIPYDNPQFATVNAINLESKKLDSKTIAVEDSQNMYMSEDNIFITYTKYINEWTLRQEITQKEVLPSVSESDIELIEKIKQVDPSILSKYEKENKINQIINSYVRYMTYDEQIELENVVEKKLKKVLEQYDSLEYTVIHKINVDKNDITVKANGQVPGRILNQFSLDEFENVLRIATTVNQRFLNQFEDVEISSVIGIAPRQFGTENNIYTLDENLKQLDRLEGLAKGERIFSTRFIGEKLYMVTFRQVDPFFVIDLSNPKNIKELGELKIPGFSRYLQAYDENTIIGIGREATEQGRTQGLKISLFDVSDVNNPIETAKFVAKGQYSQSTAEYEHKAFLLSKEKNLLVIPAFSYNYQEGGQDYNGAMVFHITNDEITIRGIIDHSGTQRSYQTSVERSLYIEELLYTKSYNLLRINNIDDLSKVKNIDLTEEGPYEVY